MSAADKKNLPNGRAVADGAHDGGGGSATSGSGLRRGGSARVERLKSIGLALTVIAGLAFAAYFAIEYLTNTSHSGAGSRAAQSATSQSSQPSPDNEPSIISQIFGPSSSSPGDSPAGGFFLRGARLGLRLLVAALLAAMLAYRPYKKKLRLLYRNPYVAETQILLAVVASALMIIVADNAARAFGIFAAASLVRFRTNIRDPKETTVLLINLAIGLAAGVGRFELAVMLSVFVLATLWILEKYESKQLMRSMQLKVRTRDVSQTDEVIRRVFDRHKVSAEVREIDREDEHNPLGRVVYHATVSTAVNTDQLSEEIFSADPRNVDTVEWHQKKSTTYLYR